MLGDSKSGGHSRPKSGTASWRKGHFCREVSQAGRGGQWGRLWAAGYQVLLRDLALKMPTLLDHGGVGSRNSSL